MPLSSVTSTAQHRHTKESNYRIFWIIENFVSITIRASCAESDRTEPYKPAFRLSGTRSRQRRLYDDSHLDQECVSGTDTILLA